MMKWKMLSVNPDDVLQFESLFWKKKRELVIYNWDILDLFPGSRFCRKKKNVKIAVNSDEKKIYRKAPASFCNECGEFS